MMLSNGNKNMKQLLRNTIRKALEPVKKMLVEKEIPQRIARAVLERANIDIVATGIIHPERSAPKPHTSTRYNQARIVPVGKLSAPTYTTIH